MRSLHIEQKVLMRLPRQARDDKFKCGEVVAVDENFGVRITELISKPI
jgi:hypothetical protein